MDYLKKMFFCCFAFSFVFKINIIMVVWHRMGGKAGRVKGVLHVLTWLFFFLVEGDEKACDPSQSYNVTWYLRYSDCYNEVFNFGVRIVWKNMAYRGKRIWG